MTTPPCRVIDAKLPATAAPGFAPRWASLRTRLAGVAVAIGAVLTWSIIGPAAAQAESPDPNQVLEVQAADVDLSAGYWTGAATGDLVISVRNVGVATAVAKGLFALPAGVRADGASGSGGCSPTTGREFQCILGVGAPAGKIVVKISVGSEAWRQAPLVGNASAYAYGTTDGDGFSVLLPAGPPTAAARLSSTDVVLPATAQTGQSDHQRLTVRFGNPGPVPVPAALDLVTPAGVAVTAVPGACTGQQRLASDRTRCQLGQIPAGQELSLTFELTVSRAAAIEAPLSGTLFGYVTPTREDSTSAQAAGHTGYRILVAERSSQEPGDPDPSASASQSSAADLVIPTRDRRDADRTQSDDRGIPLPAIIASVVGVVAIVFTLVFASLRRWMRDDLAIPQPSGTTVSESGRS